MHSNPPFPTDSTNTFPPSPKRMLGEPSDYDSASGQISLSPDELSALITKAVADVISAHDAKKAITSFSELPKLKSLPTVHLTTPDIGKSFVPKLPYFNGNKKEFLGWWRQVVLHLGGYKEIPNDMQKIMIVLSLMKGGSAERFANMFIDTHDLNWYSFEEFK